VTFLETDPKNIYRTLDMLGKGASGSVFIVKHKTTGEQFAMKRMIPKNPRENKEIRNEVSMMVLSGHPNLIRQIETFYFNNAYWLV